MINIIISILVILLCVVIYIYNRKIFQKRTVKKLTEMVEKQIGERLLEAGAKSEDQRAQITIAYLRELEGKVKQDNKKGRMIEFKKMVEHLYGEGFIKKRESLKKYLDGLDSRLGL